MLTLRCAPLVGIAFRQSAQIGKAKSPARDDDLQPERIGGRPVLRTTVLSLAYEVFPLDIKNVTLFS